MALGAENVQNGMICRTICSRNEQPLGIKCLQLGAKVIVLMLFSDSLFFFCIFFLEINYWQFLNFFSKIFILFSKEKRSATLQNWNKLRGIWGKKRSNNTSDLISNPHLAMKESVTNRPATNGDYGTKQRSVENQSNSRNLQEKDLNRID